jgi:hypothetical protein
MTVDGAMRAAGVLSSEDSKMLGEVFAATGAALDSDVEREEVASLILAHFRAGITDRDALIELMNTRR